MRFRLLSLVLIAVSALQQTRSALGDPVIRIDVDLVQVDAVVTDSRGQPVRDLTAADFEILQDRKPRKITNFSWVNTTNASAGNRPVSRSAALDDLPTTAPPRLKPEDVKRTVALVVDDLGLSFESIARVRESLKQFVAREMQPGDLVAIVRTGGGMGALQQFTTDKRLLYAAIDRVKYNAIGRLGVSSFEPIEPAPDALDPGPQCSYRAGKGRPATGRG